VLDIGEDLVGAYFRQVEGCDLVAFNTRTGEAQAEIDVIAIRLEQGGPKEVWLCEVSTHTGGLGGYRGDPVSKLAAKLGAVREYAARVFPDAVHHVEFWSPKVRRGLIEGLEGLQESDGVALIINEVYAQRVRALVSAAREVTAYSDHPSFRLLQILACLSESPLQK
jgi:hypothetical protein